MIAIVYIRPDPANRNFESQSIENLCSTCSSSSHSKL